MSNARSSTKSPESVFFQNPILSESPLVFPLARVTAGDRRPQLHSKARQTQCYKRKQLNRTLEKHAEPSDAAFLGENFPWSQVAMQIRHRSCSFYEVTTSCSSGNCCCIDCCLLASSCKVKEKQTPERRGYWKRPGIGIFLEKPSRLRCA